MSPSEHLSRTPLHAAHLRLGARMCGFAGYDMPLNYAEGVLAEHRWTRAHAGLFDVSHMGAARLVLAEHPGDAELAHQTIAALVEPLICGDVRGLAPGSQRYSLLLNEDGGVADDLIIGRTARLKDQNSLDLVVNAATKAADFARIRAAVGDQAQLVPAGEDGMIALQGPDAAAVIAALCPAALEMAFMQFRRFEVRGVSLMISRSGYTGEDGFEILVPGEAAEDLWERLLADPRVRPIGLAARDSLRLEAGLPLYGHDLDATTSPVEAGLAFAVSERRRRAADFPGAERILRELAEGPARVRVGLRVQGAPAREGAAILHDGREVGRVTSGGFSPSLSAPIAMGFVPPALAAPGTGLSVVVRDRAQPAEVTALPFVPHRYVRNP
jgi:aminomethyltransferase